MLYAITNRQLYAADEPTRRERLFDLTALWTANRVAFIQLREKDLPAHEQVELARAIMDLLRTEGKGTAPAWKTRLLINGRPDVALAAGADGVHLPTGPDALTPEQVRNIFAAANANEAAVVSVSCHTLAEVEAARQHQVECILFAPVFEKAVPAPAQRKTKGSTILPGTGLQLLGQACRAAAPTPVFALGGVTAENAARCMDAGAAGVAGIRLLQNPPAIWAHLA